MPCHAGCPSTLSYPFNLFHDRIGLLTQAGGRDFLSDFQEFVGVGLDGTGGVPDGMSLLLDGMSFLLDGTGVALDGNGVAPDGTGVALDGKSVLLDGLSFLLDGTGVLLDGTGVAHDGNGGLQDVIGGLRDRFVLLSKLRVDSFLEFTDVFIGTLSMSFFPQIN